MKILIPIILILFFSCEDKDNNPDTIFDYTLHKNNRVASLKMSDSDYDSWVNEDGFADTESRVRVVNDLTTYLMINMTLYFSSLMNLLFQKISSITVD